jgi:hypothetical protein
MTFSEFFSKNYLFDPAPDHESRLFLPLLIFFSFITIISLTHFIVPSFRKLTKFKDIAVAFLSTGVLGLLYVFARDQELPWFGSRIFLFVLILALLVWVAVNVIKIIVKLPSEKAEKFKQNKFERYLPKQKKTK